jgi:hypothetical protein
VNNARISKCSSGKKGNLLPPCCPRAAPALFGQGGGGEVVPAAPVIPAPLPLVGCTWGLLVGGTWGSLVGGSWRVLVGGTWPWGPLISRWDLETVSKWDLVTFN